VMAQTQCTSINETGDTVATGIDKLAYPKKGYKHYGKWIDRNRNKELQTKNKADRKTVFVIFTVHEDGTRTNFEILKGVGEPYDSEAVRLVRENPQEWIAAECATKKIKARSVIPISF
jgi:hypothetical protein